MTDREVMQMALETAEQIACADYRHWEELASLSEFERWARSRANHIADALRTALAQPDPEPVAWAYKVNNTWEQLSFIEPPNDAYDDDSLVPLYIAPSHRKWVGLTDEEYELMAEKRVTNYFFNTLDYAHAIEAKLKEKNT